MNLSLWFSLAGSGIRAENWALGCWQLLIIWVVHCRDNCISNMWSTISQFEVMIRLGGMLGSYINTPWVWQKVVSPNWDSHPYDSHLWPENNSITVHSFSGLISSSQVNKTCLFSVWSVWPHTHKWADTGFIYVHSRALAHVSSYPPSFRLIIITNLIILLWT